MATIKIIVRREKGQLKLNQRGQVLLFIQYVHDGKAVLFSTETKIEPEFLKFNGMDIDQRNPIKKTLPGFSTKNSNILKLVQKIDQIKDRLINQDKIPSSGEVKKLYEEKHTPQKPVINDFFTLFDQFISDCKATKARNTIKQYITCINHLKAYQTFSKRKITFDNINLPFYDHFQSYLIQEVGLANNSIGTQIKDLKAFLNYVKRRGVVISADLSEFKILREKPVIIYLSQKEVEILYSLDFKNSPSLEKSRDLFILQAQTGLRYSDLSRLGIEHLDGNMLRLKAHKTKKDIKVPLTPIASTILKKYNFELPVLSEPKQNKHIKQVCKAAGFKQKIEIPSYHGGSKTYRTFEKWELITTHIAVKTFITHCGELGISPKVVSEITGKTVKVIIEHYYGTNDKIIESEMEKAFGTVK